MTGLISPMHAAFKQSLGPNLAQGRTFPSRGIRGPVRRGARGSLKKKERGERIEKPRREEPSKVVNLMDALRRSA